MNPYQPGYWVPDQYESGPQEASSSRFWQISVSSSRSGSRQSVFPSHSRAAAQETASYWSILSPPAAPGPYPSRALPKLPPRR